MDTNELECLLSLDDGNILVDFLWNNVSSLHQAASHVLSVVRIALGHLVGGLKNGAGELCDGDMPFRWIQQSVGAEHKVDTRIGDQVCLELVDVHVECSVEAEGGGK